MDKKELRKKFRQIRNSDSCISQKSLKICSLLCESNIYKDCDSVFTYYGIGSEIKTDFLIKKALCDGKKTALPVMTENEGEMVFIEIKDTDSLKERRYGILEPDFDENKILMPDRKTLLVVPGLAFDENLYRLGYGGGYYDRYIEKYDFMETIGLFSELQKTNELEYGCYDKKLNHILTERNLYYENTDSDGD
jgi:5-formyltetrahydrofolate cyclo-ligase